MSWKLKKIWANPRIRTGSWWKEKFVTELGTDKVASKQCLWADRSFIRTSYLVSLALFCFQLICSAKYPPPTLNSEILLVNYLTSFYDIFFSSSWIEKSVLNKWVISLLGSLFIHFLYEKALRLRNPRLTLASCPALREVKLETSRGPSSWSSRKHILHFQSLELLFYF